MRFDPCDPCCGGPIIIIDVGWRSYVYSYTCIDQNDSGTGGIASCGSVSSDDPPGECLRDPLQRHIDAWNEDLQNWNAAIENSRLPVAAAMLHPGPYCWWEQGGLYPVGAGWPSDSYDSVIYRPSTKIDQWLLVVDDAKQLFVDLMDRQGLTSNSRAFFLFLNSTSSSSQFDVNNRNEFLLWIHNEYPNVGALHYRSGDLYWLGHWATWIEELQNNNPYLNGIWTDAGRLY